MIGPYGILVAGGIAAGAAVIFRLARRAGAQRLAVMDIVFWAVVGGIIGARALFVLIEWQYFQDLCTRPEAVLPVGIACTTDVQCYPGQACDGTWCRPVGDCLAAFKFWHGGWVFLGGVLGAIPALLAAARVRKVPLATALGLLSVGLPLGHVFGRVGCFVKGCCFGRPWEHGLAPDGRYPVQLVEAGGELVIFALLLWRFLRLTRGGRHPGRTDMLSLPALYLTLYGPLRFATEMFRGDRIRGFLVEIPWPAFARFFDFSPREPVFLSTSQAISLGMLVLGLVFWGATSLRRPRTARCGSSPAA